MRYRAIGIPSGLCRASAIWILRRPISRKSPGPHPRCTCRRDFICPWPVAFASDKSDVVGNGDDATFYFAQLGLKRQFVSYGQTTFYGEIGDYKNYSVGRVLQADLAAPTKAIATWGMVTRFRSPALGRGYRTSFDRPPRCFTHNINIMMRILLEYLSGLTEVQSLPVEPWSAVILGARVQWYRYWKRLRGSKRRTMSYCLICAPGCLAAAVDRRWHGRHRSPC